MKKWILIALGVVTALVIAAAAACAIVWNKNEFTLELTLAGEKEITLEYGEAFQDPGASAEFYGSVLDKEHTEVAVTVQGQVDTSKVGTYTVTYSAAYTADYKLVKTELSDTQTRTVHVVDTQKPTITLVSNPGTYTLPGHAYEEEGFTASDGYDGDLTDKVERVEAEGTVTYRVSDSSGNTVEAVRTIYYDDPIPPVLTLQGELIMNIEYGADYKEPGFTAEDNCDGDITHRVTVSGEINTSKAGNYTLTYTVSDEFGNTVSATRTVTVLRKGLPDIDISFPNPPLAPTGKVIYLTFDDGPGKHTERLLDVLKKYDVKATFFVVNSGYLGLLPRMVAEGHTVAMHTSTHNYAQVYASEEAYFKDLNTIESLIAEQIGYAPKMLRFPGGSSNSVSKISMYDLIRSITEKGYKYFDWNVDSKDAGGATSAEEVFYNVVAGIGKKTTSVVLQHDTHGFSVDAVEKIIQWGLANGYTFLPLDEDSPGCHHRSI